MFKVQARIRFRDDYEKMWIALGFAVALRQQQQYVFNYMKEKEGLSCSFSSFKKWLYFKFDIVNEFTVYDQWFEKNGEKPWWVDLFYEYAKDKQGIRGSTSFIMFEQAYLEKKLTQAQQQIQQNTIPYPIQPVKVETEMCKESNILPQDENNTSDVTYGENPNREKKLSLHDLMGGYNQPKRR